MGTEHEIEGFTAPASVLPGEPVDLILSSTRRRARVEALRVGWYDGAEAIRVWSADDVRVHDRSTDVAFDDATRTISTGWEPTLRVPTDGWPAGAYLFRLTAASGAQQYIPFVVRSPEVTGRVLVVHAVTTWQAYNTWGGYSLYQGPGGSADYDNRAYVVSLDRPFDGNGAVKFLAYERPVVVLAERLGISLAYTTSDQVDTDSTLCRSARALVSLGHDEYWSPSMRAHVTAARDYGVNVAFLGANACFRRIRLQASPLGPGREVVCYKTSYPLDPMYGVDDAKVTSDWREPPHPDPESSLIGTLYEEYPTSAGFVVATPDAWPFRGTGATAGSVYPNLVGPEYDRVNPVIPLQRPMTILSHSPLTCKGVNSYSDSAYYTHRSGAGVLNVGTMRWAGALDGDGGYVDHRTRAFTRRVTANILREFSRGPAAERLPARDNVDEFHEYVGDPIYAQHNLW